jgi:hypothetical protein
MRAGTIRIIFGIALIVGGYAADSYFTGLYWFGAYIVGVIEIIHGIVIIVRTRRLMAE